MPVPHMTVLGQIIARRDHYRKEQASWPETAPYHLEGYAIACSLLSDVDTLLKLIQPLLNATETKD